MLEIGSTIDGKYKILNKIGQGGMSVVYLAMNEKANKQWAIKEVRKDGIENFEVIKQGLIVETDMLKKLSHSNLPSIIDVIEDHDTFLIVMDYIEGQPLSSFLEESGPWQQEYVIDWAKQLCDVLGYLHTRTPSIIYRDMKPANIMLKPDGDITLIDFGTAREYKELNLADTTCLGTIGYAAPEQFGGQGQTDARTDIYCLGATLYHLVTGCNPCEPPYEIVPIRQINPALSGGLEKIVIKCTQRNPDDRYQTCTQLMYDLEHYDEMDDIYRKKQKKRVLAVASCFFMALICMGISGWGYLTGSQVRSENYDIRLAWAKDSQQGQSEREKQYLEAIRIDPSDQRAYLELVSLFLNSEDTEGSLSREEASLLTQLRAGLDVKENNGYSRTIYPLDELKKLNSSGYAEVCFETGMAYWYDYEVQTERYSQAAEWFQEAKSFYPVADAYCAIGECQLEIKKYSGQNRTEKMYAAYKMLWERLGTLKKETDTLNDNDVKLLVWSEIVNTISSKAAYFVVNTPSAEIMALLGTIKQEAAAFREETKYEDIKENMDTLLGKTEEAVVRLEAAAAITTSNEKEQQ